ncbi:5-formyltetrahydrofolate cyclo-ligase [Lacticaseibacillus sp. GG6-2]
MNSEKKTFRTTQIARLQTNAAATKAASATLLAKLVALPAWQQARTIGVTVSNGFEVPTAPVIEAAQAAGKQVLIPRCMPQRQLAFLPDPGPDHRIKSKFGIPEPAYDPALVDDQPDLLLVPGIAYAIDTHYRIGFGGGYYDRFLARYLGHTVTLAAPSMVYPTAAWPVEAFDMRIQTLITV